MRKQSFIFDFIKITGFSLSILLSHAIFSQTPTAGDCLGATSVCQDIYYEPTIFSGPGNYPAELPICANATCNTCCPNNCLEGEWNSAWYIFTVQQSGLLRFEIQPDVASDDYDWAVYDLSLKRCEDLHSMANSLQRSCNAAGIMGPTGMNTANGGYTSCNVCGTTNKWNSDLQVQEGQTYVLYVSNWGDEASGGFTLDFSGSTAAIYDDVAPTIVHIGADEVHGCNETEIAIQFSENITCAGVGPPLFSIDGPGGPYTVTDVYGLACDVGGDWEKDFVLTVDHPFTSNGTYTLTLSLGLPGIQDPCGNTAPADTISFTLDLGAPVISTITMAITNSTCGMDNGSIVGLIANGQSSLTYVWKNGQGAIVGNSLDLLNIPAGSYSLEVYDQNDCVSYAGPFEVAEFGVPEIDDSNISITPANYGASNGSIAGIEVNAAAAISEYIWRDDQGAVVGNSLDLSNVASGYYTLTVIDENTCEVYAGPYFVGEIGGPLTTNPSASPEEICRGESSTLTSGVGGGSGAYEYLWSSTPAGFSSTLANPVVAPIISTTYHVEVFDGYLTEPGDVEVIVNQLPVPDAGIDQSIAHGTSTILHGSATVGSGDYAYSWTPIDKLVDATLADPSTKNIYESTQFYLEIEDLMTGCISEEPDNMVVNITGGILTVNPSSFPDSVFCIEETFWLYANAGGGAGVYTYTWTSEPPMSLPSDSSFSLSLAEAGTYYFYVKINDGYNDAYDYVEVLIQPAPEINLGAPMQSVCVFDTVILDACNPGSEYLWSNGANTQQIIVGTSGLGYDEQSYSVVVTNVDGCIADTGVNIVFDYDACVGITEYTAQLQARVYPNPSTGKIIIEIDDVYDPVNIDVIDILGNIKYHERLNSANNAKLKKSIDLSALASGTYFIKLHTLNALKIVEIILE